MVSKPFSQQSEDYQRIEKAIGFLENNFKSQPRLDEIAASVHLSKYDFDRLFRRWAGVSAIQFFQFLTLDYTKKKLADTHSFLESSLDAGLSGPGRLHDLFVTFDAMTPGQFKKSGAGVQISYAFYASPFGECLLALTGRGICHLGFVREGNRSGMLAQVQKAWPNACFAEDRARVNSVANRVFRAEMHNPSKPFHLFLKGTDFQVNVWRALLSIPKGGVAGYQAIARHMGRPKATRAVAGAIAANPVGYLIPCHRVIAKSGRIHQYRWGALRKKAMIGWEAAQMVIRIGIR